MNVWSVSQDLADHTFRGDVEDEDDDEGDDGDDEGEKKENDENQEENDDDQIRRAGTVGSQRCN